MESGTPDGLPSPLDAVPDMRASAKWILAATAGVGAALLGGGPLLAIGRVTDAGRLTLAFVGLVVALGGVGWAIWRTADALIPPLTTPSSLDSDPGLAELRRRIAAEPAAFYGPFGDSLGEVGRAAAFHRTVAGNLADALAQEADPVRQAVLTAKLADARDAAAAASARARRLLELAHAWQVRDQLRRARLHTMAGAAVAAVGATLFLAAAR